MAGKIALVGSAPSSIDEMPYGDKSWKLWGCSPALMVYCREKGLKGVTFDEWFEIHPWVGNPDFGPNYREFLKNHEGPVWMIQHEPTVPNSRPYPRAEMNAKFSQYFWTSSLAWMFAKAISEQPEEIGIWGIDMSHTTEWGEQRQGCQYFVSIAKAMGIKVTVPSTSDLLCPPPQYGFAFASHFHAKMHARLKEFDGRLANLTKDRDNKNQEIVYLSGARENLLYQLKTWPADQIDFPMVVPTQVPKLEPQGSPTAVVNDFADSVDTPKKRNRKRT